MIDNVIVPVPFTSPYSTGVQGNAHGILVDRATRRFNFEASSKRTCPIRPEDIERLEPGNHSFEPLALVRSDLVILMNKSVDTGRIRETEGEYSITLQVF